MLISRRDFMVLTGSFLAATSASSAAPFSCVDNLFRGYCGPASRRPGFRIEGWEDAITPMEVNEQVVIRLGQGWRGSWR